MSNRLQPNPELRCRLASAGAFAGLNGALLVGIVASTVDVDGTVDVDEAWRIVVALLVCATPIGALLGRACARTSTRATVGLSVAAALLTSFPTAIVLVLLGRVLGRTLMEWSSAPYLAFAGDAYSLPPLLGYGVVVGLALDHIRERTLAASVNRNESVARVFD